MILIQINSLSLLFLSLTIITCTKTTLYNEKFTRQDNEGSADEACETFTKTQGTCVPFNQCQNIKNFISSLCCPSETATPTPRQSPSECGRKINVNTSEVIIGGRPAALNAWPWMAAIFDEKFGVTGFHCGGIVINNNYILTAAHCVEDRIGRIPANKFTVRLGDLDLTNDQDGATPVTIGVKNISIHPEFSIKSILHDIALMELSEPITWSNAISPICLPTRKQDTESFVNMKPDPTVAGWGFTESGRGSNVLLQAQIPIVDLEECKSVYFNAPIGPTQLCAGYPEGGKDACQGDSGGPLMRPELQGSELRWTVIGIVSTAHDCAKAGYPGIYTRVSSYLEWIEENVK